MLEEQETGQFDFWTIVLTVLTTFEKQSFCFGWLPELFKMISYKQDRWSPLVRDPMTLLFS